MNEWLEGELGSEAMMALGDLLREGTPFTLMHGTPHREGFQPLLDWGYIRCDECVETLQDGTKILSVTPEGRRYYVELRLRANALSREIRAIDAAVSAAKFTALAACIALISPVQEVAKDILLLFGVSDNCADGAATVAGLLLVVLAGYYGYQFFRSDRVLNRGA